MQKTRTILKSLLKIIILFLVIAGLYYYFQAQAERRIEDQKILMEMQLEHERELQKDKIFELEDDILNQLSGCETGGIKDQDGAIILDTNKKMSIGRYMWQRESVKYYYKKFYNKNITNHEAIAISINEELATKLTRKVLFEEKNGWKNWYNCGKKLNFASQIDAINKIR